MSSYPTLHRYHIAPTSSSASAIRESIGPDLKMFRCIRRFRTWRDIHDAGKVRARSALVHANICCASVIGLARRLKKLERDLACLCAVVGCASGSSVDETSEDG